MRMCFIDDDGRFEIPLFRRVFADEFDLVCSTDLAKCKEEIQVRSQSEAWVPDLFVLDLYLPDSNLEADPNYLEEISRASPEFFEDSGSLLVASTNYKKAERRLAELAIARAQSAGGGIALAQDVHRSYRDVPILFYSRKATMKDAIRCMSENMVVGVIHKPMGDSETEIGNRTLADKDALSAQFRLVTTREFQSRVLRVKASIQEMLQETSTLGERNMLVDLASTGSIPPVCRVDFRKGPVKRIAIRFAEILHDAGRPMQAKEIARELDAEPSHVWADLQKPHEIEWRDMWLDRDFRGKYWFNFPDED